MHSFSSEAAAFRSRKQAETSEARQRAALQLSCGIDLSDTFCSGAESALHLIGRIDRAIERERLKGVNRHWSYDLNRHIALKQVRDRLRGLLPIAAADSKPAPPRRRRPAKSKTAPEGAVC